MLHLGGNWFIKNSQFKMKDYDFPLSLIASWNVSSKLICCCWFLFFFNRALQSSSIAAYLKCSAVSAFTNTTEPHSSHKSCHFEGRLSFMTGERCESSSEIHLIVGITVAFFHVAAQVHSETEGSGGHPLKIWRWGTARTKKEGKLRVSWESTSSNGISDISSITLKFV